MKPVPAIRRRLLPAAVALVLTAAKLPSAMVTWGPAFDIADDSDVSLNGTLVTAHHFNGAPAAVPVNTVAFQPFAANTFGSGSFTVGAHTLASTFFTGAGNTGSAQPPFTDLSEPYQAMLRSSVSSIADMYLTLGGLTVGQKYEFQTWANNSSDAFHYGVTVGDALGNEVFLSAGSGSGTPDDPLQLGQYALGTFTADASTQMIVFAPDEVANINGFQLRQLDTIVVPEPGTFLMGGVALGALAGGVWLRRRKH